VHSCWLGLRGGGGVDRLVDQVGGDLAERDVPVLCEGAQHVERGFRRAGAGCRSRSRWPGRSPTGRTARCAGGRSRLASLWCRNAAVTVAAAGWVSCVAAVVDAASDACAASAYRFTCPVGATSDQRRGGRHRPDSVRDDPGRVRGPAGLLRLVVGQHRGSGAHRLQAGVVSVRVAARPAIGPTRRRTSP